MKDYWTSTDCAREWGVEAITARRLMKRCNWQYREDENNIRIVTVPIGTPKPDKLKPGVKPKPSK